MTLAGFTLFLITLLMCYGVGDETDDEPLEDGSPLLRTEGEDKEKKGTD